MCRISYRVFEIEVFHLEIEVREGFFGAQTAPRVIHDNFVLSELCHHELSNFFEQRFVLVFYDTIRLLLAVNIRVEVEISVIHVNAYPVSLCSDFFLSRAFIFWICSCYLAASNNHCNVLVVERGPLARNSSVVVARGNAVKLSEVVCFLISLSQEEAIFTASGRFHSICVIRIE